MRFCLVSTHTDQTIGYSKIAENLLKHLANKSKLKQDKKVQIFHFGFQRHAARANLKKVPIGVNSYDAAINEDPKEEGFGYNKFKEYLDMVRPDVVMIYNDILTISKFLDAMMTDPTQKTQELSSNPNKYNVALKPKFKLWLYLDVMYTGMHPVLLKKVFEITDRIYVFSETAKKHMKMYEDANLYGKLPDIRVQEHAVDEAVYFSPKETKFITRFSLGVPKDGIVFLNCNRNSGRKRLDTSVMAFARLLGRFRDFKEKDSNFKVPDVYFVFATGGVNGKPGNPSFYDIPRMYMEELKKLSFNLNEEIWKKKLILIDTNVNIINDEGMNELYNLCDIGVNTSNGEGFGLCTFEHMVANGAAQVVTDVGCYSEYLSGPLGQDSPLGFIVKKSGHGYFDVGQCAFGFEYPVFDVNDVADAFEKCVLNLDEWKSRARLVKKNLKTWEDATEGLWEDILKELK